MVCFVVLWYALYFMLYSVRVCYMHVYEKKQVYLFILTHMFVHVCMRACLVWKSCVRDAMHCHVMSLSCHAMQCNVM